jgi:small subunit ribosomal protein S20
VVEIPKIRSAKKRLRQSERRRGLNRARKAALRRVVKQIRLHIESGEKDAASALLPQLAKAADKAAKRHTIHRNRASRIKARWTRKIHAL